MSSLARLWFGYLNTGNSYSSSLVVYDRFINRNVLKDQVFLYDLKRDQIAPYAISVVRTKLRGLLPEEYGLVDYAQGCYFAAKKRWSAKQSEADSEGVRQIKHELREDEERYEQEHAGDQYKTDEDWAAEYLSSDDSSLRELGRIILGGNTVDQRLQNAEGYAQLSEVAKWLADSK